MTERERAQLRLARLKEAREDGFLWTANDEEEYQALLEKLRVRPNWR
ncbi:hypothetical protein [Deinococcus humi]|uniref:Uncharacterized protein n=1 Tax=Deinococcus humi TaxID=662880 RepID=A0A7W8JQF1_9DEIO|nr:hypothetical protein [Deinococcus humi]MBB5361317.1 hypothetical protein [Deinococcus humi]GGO19452.1 hypothetical protein GCM10008949_03820 [Deinococcus humi]